MTHPEPSQDLADVREASARVRIGDALYQVEFDADGDQPITGELVVSTDDIVDEGLSIATGWTHRVAGECIVDLRLRGRVSTLTRTVAPVPSTSDEDVYQRAARAYDRRDDPAELEPPRPASVLANHPAFRAAVDEARRDLDEDLARARATELAISARCKELRADLAAARAEIAAQAATITELRALHAKSQTTFDGDLVDKCDHCTELCAGVIFWPCPTIALLDGTDD